MHKSGIYLCLIFCFIICLSGCKLHGSNSAVVDEQLDLPLIGGSGDSMTVRGVLRNPDSTPFVGTFTVTVGYIEPGAFSNPGPTSVFRKFGYQYHSFSNSKGSYEFEVYSSTKNRSGKAADYAEIRITPDKSGPDLPEGSVFSDTEWDKAYVNIQPNNDTELKPAYIPIEGNLKTVFGDNTDPFIYYAVCLSKPDLTYYYQMYTDSQGNFSIPWKKAYQNRTLSIVPDLLSINYEEKLDAYVPIKHVASLVNGIINYSFENSTRDGGKVPYVLKIDIVTNELDENESLIIKLDGLPPSSFPYNSCSVCKGQKYAYIYVESLPGTAHKLLFIDPLGKRYNSAANPTEISLSTSQFKNGINKSRVVVSIKK